MADNDRYAAHVARQRQDQDLLKAQIRPLALPELRLPECTPAADSCVGAQGNDRHQSAGDLMRRLAGTITQWRKELPQGVQPALLALAHGGVQISVTSLAQESFHGIRIDGHINGAPCMLLAHQATVQILCYAEEIKPPEQPKRSIGFVIDGEHSQA
jgi:hypothetical protein